MSGVGSLTSFLEPQSIAIIGASNNTEKISGRPLQTLKRHGYSGNLYPINPRYAEIDGIRCYPDLADLPECVDLAIIVVAASGVLEVLRHCAAQDVKFAMIVSSGFAESGHTGKELQQEIRSLCNRTGLRVSGPNTQGYLNLSEQGWVAATFSSALQLPDLSTGGLGFVSQSGAFGFSTFCLGQEAGVGFSKVVSTGNEVDVTWLDIVEYLIDDPATQSIAAYVEGIRDGNRLPALAQRALGADKPLTVLKVGRTQAGGRAAASHTAAITGSDAIFDAACRQYGVQRAGDIGDIFDIARVFSAKRRSDGNRLGILTTSGGAGAVAADEAVELGLEVAPLSESVRQDIEQFIPAFGSAHNPVDITAEVLRRPESFRGVLASMLDDDTVNMLVVVLTMVTGESAKACARDVVDIAATSAKPIAVAWSVSEVLAGDALAHLRNAGIPLYPTPVRAVRALKAVAGFSLAAAQYTSPRYESVTPPVGVASGVRRRLSGLTDVTEHEAKALLSEYGIPVVREEIVDSPASAVGAANRIGYPVAVKILARGLNHKTEAGGVRLNLYEDDAVRAATESILADVSDSLPESRIEGLLVQEMIPNGTEMILGMLRDSELGTTIMLGAGGIFVELTEDVSYRLAPIEYREAESMIADLKSAKLLSGTRGQPPADREALINTLCRLSALAVDLGDDVRELEINPLIVLPDGEGVRAADALVVPG